MCTAKPQAAPGSSTFSNQRRIRSSPTGEIGCSTRAPWRAAYAEPAWSPDSHWLVFVPTGIDGFTNLFAVPADGSAPAQPLTFLANGQTASRLAWSPDGTYILFDTSQRSETSQLARVDLVPHLPKFREDQFRELFRSQSTPGAPDAPPATTPNEPATPNPTTPRAPHLVPQ